MTREWLRLKDVPGYCGISKRTAREWMRSGLRYSRIKGVVLVKREWLDEFIESYSADHGWEDQLNFVVDEVMSELGK